MHKMKYDIRSSGHAKHTLVDITGVPIPVWERYLGHEHEYEYVDDLVETVVQRHGHLPASYKEFDFIFFHITTSANQCASYLQKGLMDLKHAYMIRDSELRSFLDAHNIHIDLDAKVLTHNGKRFDISYGPCPSEDKAAYQCWSIGRKFYFDFTVCGFLSVWENNPYGGQVHHRPEILEDIDNLLHLNLSHEWRSTHTPYEVTAMVDGRFIVYDGDDESPEKDKVLSFLTMAYDTAFGEPFERVLMLQNNVQIPPSDILQIKPLSHWVHFR